MSDHYNSYKVWLRSVPGMYGQYNGYVDVVASDEDHAVERAMRELQRTTFKDRGPSMWRVEKVERIYDR